MGLISVHIGQRMLRIEINVPGDGIGREMKTYRYAAIVCGGIIWIASVTTWIKGLLASGL